MPKFAMVIKLILFFMLISVSRIFAQDISIFTISTDLIDLSNIFAGEKFTRTFRVSLDPAVTNKILNYKIIRPTNSPFCNSILFKPEEQNDAINSSFLSASSDREDIWELVIEVPELENSTLASNKTMISAGNYECNIQVEAISVQDETSQPSPPSNGSGGGSAPGNDVNVPSQPQGQSGSGGGGFLIVSQQTQQKGEDFQTNAFGLVVDNVPPKITPPTEDLFLINESFKIKEIGSDYIIIMFNTSLPLYVKVVYDVKSHDPIESDKKNYGYASSTEETTSSGSFFEIKLVGLNPDTAYYFRIVMRNLNLIKPSKEFYVKTLTARKTPEVAKQTVTATTTQPRGDKEEGQEQEANGLTPKFFSLANLKSFLSNLPVEMWLIIILALILIIDYIRRKVIQRIKKLKKHSLFTRLKKYFIVLIFLLLGKKKKKGNRFNS